MRYVTFRHNREPRPGISTPEGVVDAQQAYVTAGIDGHAGPPATTRGLLGLGEAQRRELDAAASACAAAGDLLGFDEIELGPPVPDPDKVICVGFNYRAHADEFETELPAAPNLFPKFRTSLIGPQELIRVPPVATEIDFEGELAVVIGAVCKDVSAAAALDYVAGCMVFNDVTARDLQFKTTQWLAGKAVDTFAPCGPALVTLDEIGDIGNLRLETRVNGVVMQDSTTSRMVYPVADLIAYTSALVTLVPGDIIATGTPEGVGFRREPPVFLTDGDVVEVTIEQIGTLRNTVATVPRRAGESLERPEAIGDV